MPAQGVKTPDAALDGARDIVAEVRQLPIDPWLYPCLIMTHTMTAVLTLVILLPLPSTNDYVVEAAMGDTEVKKAGRTGLRMGAALKVHEYYMSITGLRMGAALKVLLLRICWVSIAIRCSVPSPVSLVIRSGRVVANDDIGPLQCMCCFQHIGCHR